MVDSSNRPLLSFEVCLAISFFLLLLSKCKCVRSKAANHQSARYDDDDVEVYLVTFTAIPEDQSRRAKKGKEGAYEEIK